MFTTSGKRMGHNGFFLSSMVTNLGQLSLNFPLSDDEKNIGVENQMNKEKQTENKIKREVSSDDTSNIWSSLF